MDALTRIPPKHVIYTDKDGKVHSREMWGTFEEIEGLLTAWQARYWEIGIADVVIVSKSA